MPVLQPVDPVLLELRRDHRDRRLGIADCQPGPPREVGRQRRAATPEVPQRERREGLVAAQWRRRLHPFVEQRVGRLRPLRRATADERIQLRLHHDVADRLPLQHMTVARQRRTDIAAREMAAALEGPRDNGMTRREDRGRQAGLAIVGRGGIPDTRRGQREHPADVPGHDVMPCRPQHVGADDCPGVKRGAHRRVRRIRGPLRDRPAGAGGILRLHGAQVVDHRGRRGQPRTEQALIAESLGEDGEHGVTQRSAVVVVAGDGVPLRPTWTSDLRAPNRLAVGPASAWSEPP